MNFTQFNEEYNRLYKEEASLYHRLARHFNLSDSAFWVLYTLEAAQRPLTQTELCSYLSLTKQTIHSALKQLEQDGDIRLFEPPGRRKYLELTPEGQALAARTVRPALQLEELAFLVMAEKDRECLLALHRQRIELLLREAEHLLNIPQEE